MISPYLQRAMRCGNKFIARPSDRWHGGTKKERKTPPLSVWLPPFWFLTLILNQVRPLIWSSIPPSRVPVSMDPLTVTVEGPSYVSARGEDCIPQTNNTMLCPPPLPNLWKVWHVGRKRNLGHPLVRTGLVPGYILVLARDSSLSNLTARLLNS